jgi:hypothetical protein
MTKAKSPLGGLLAMMLVTFGMAYSANAKDHSWKGWISDSSCAAKGMSASHKDCAMTCVKEKGASWVFVNAQTKKVYAIHNPEAVNTEEALGHEVLLTGDVMKDGSIHVVKIVAAEM